MRRLNEKRGKSAPRGARATVNWAYERGALGLLTNLFIPEKTTRHWYLIGNDRMTLMPQVAPLMTGITAAGSIF